MIMCPYCGLSIDEEEYKEVYPDAEDDRCPECGGLLDRDVEVDESSINKPVYSSEDLGEDNEEDLTGAHYYDIDEFI